MSRSTLGWWVALLAATLLACGGGDGDGDAVDAQDGQDTGGQQDTTGTDTTLEDTAGTDTTVEDTSGTDTTVEDTTGTDTTGVDTTIEDTGTDTTVAPTLTMTHAGTEIADGGTYGIPDFNPSTGAVAIYSEQKDRMVLNNTGSGALTLTSIELADVGDVLPDEFQLCTTASGVNQCIPYVLPGTLDAGANTEFYVHFYPLQSDLREATLTVQYDNGAAQTYSATIQGHGRIGDDSNPAFFFSAATETSHKLWGGFGGSDDEAPGALAADASGNLYFVNETGMSSTAATITRINADGTVGWSMQYSDFRTRETADDGGYMPPDSLDLDNGYLYVTGIGSNGALTRSVGVVLKINATTGAQEWVKYWYPTTTRLQYTDAANFMAIDADGDMVYVTGHVADYASGNQGLAVVAFAAADGALHWSRMIVPQGTTGTAHRGHSIRSAGGGVLFVAGLDYSAGSLDGPFLAKVSGADATGNLTLEWAKAIGGVVTGSNFNSMDLDANGDVFLSLGITGASREVIFVKADGSTGAMTGTKLAGGTNSWNTSFAVRTAGSYVYGGARAGVSGWDTQKSDGMLAKFNASDMSTVWSALYYTGTGANEICAHSVHGLATSGTNLYALGQVYTGNSNYYRYYGLWYDDPTAPAAYAPTVNDTTTTTTIMTLSSAGLVDGTTTNFAHAGALTTFDYAAANVEWQDATDKNETTNGAATDGDLFIATFSQP